MTDYTELREKVARRLADFLLENAFEADAQSEWPLVAHIADGVIPHFLFNADGTPPERRAATEIAAAIRAMKEKKP
jgi:hypothetical protein